MDAKDCGPACIKMIAKYYGKYYSLQYLRDLCGITREGVSFLDISYAAEKIGLRTVAVKATMENLTNRIPLPCIIHWDQHHFIVVYKTKKGKIYVSDPAKGLLSYPEEDFKDRWYKEGEEFGMLMVLEPMANFKQIEAHERIERFKSFENLLNYFTPYKKAFGILFAIMLIATGLQAVLPFISKSVIDIGIYTQDISFIYMMLIGNIVLLLSITLSNVLRDWVLLHVSTRVNISLISDYLIKLMKLPVTFFENKLVGDILQRAGDHERIRSFVMNNSLGMFFSIITFVVFSIILLIYNPMIFFIFIAGSGIYVAWIFTFLSIRKKLDWEYFELKNTFGKFGPDILVPVVGENLGVTCGNILGRSYELLSELQPEGYLVLGDTNSCLSAISAKRLHIPLFHMEAGNRCKDECLPEETNRRVVDVISDVNLCYSEFARKYLADTGLPKERTYQTGSPMAEVLHMNLEKIQKSDVLERLGLEKDKYILLSAHREENIDSEKNFLSLFTAINALAEKYDMPILYSCHPRSRHRLEKSGFQLDPRVRVNEPLGFNDYNKLQMNALAIVSDSGTLPEESSFYLSIGHPIAAVCIRTSTERPEALEAGDFILAGITTRELLNATDMAIEMKQKGVLGKPCPDYVDETVSMKVVRIIQGYVNVVNKMVWRKY